MAILIKGSELNSEIEQLFEFAKESITIISPYIKLHKRIKDILNIRKQDDITLTIVFGKNPENKKKSLSRDDIDFFKDFKDVEIRYEESLHAKIYSNEDTTILTSMNLYDFSMNNNIEFGVITHKQSNFERLTGTFSASNSLEEQSFYFVSDIIHNSKLIFKREATYKKSLLKKTYISSAITVDSTQEIVSTPIKTLKKQIGYCIRTGKEIPFNPKKPYTIEAYQSWARYKNPNYKERFCHKTGEKSSGKTSFNHPILD